LVAIRANTGSQVTDLIVSAYPSQSELTKASKSLSSAKLVDVRKATRGLFRDCKSILGEINQLINATSPDR
tara:strand:- start:694 stop:906 length:213 start_codon:yes stop_codon:yes gene_type:complete